MTTYRGEAGRSVRIGLLQMTVSFCLGMALLTPVLAASQQDRQPAHVISSVAPVTATGSILADAAGSPPSMDAASPSSGRELARVHVMAPASASVNAASVSKAELPSSNSSMSSGMELALQAVLGIALIAFGRIWFVSSIVNKR